jgi:hypothetical protein
MCQQTPSDVAPRDSVSVELPPALATLLDSLRTKTAPTILDVIRELAKDEAALRISQ